MHSNKVFTGFATRGKSSTGWFYGLKIHLIINDLGQIMNFALTPANVMDNNVHLLKKMFKGLKGKCYGDKGYLSKLFTLFYQQGMHLVTKIRENMKTQFVGNLKPKIRNCLPLKKNGLPIKLAMTLTKGGSLQLITIGSP
ncbi:transposase [Emticicia sp. 17c]|uniref:transposase n=1 Tax=Emticicia sp. 17c TaxID=3127704 RepID=UPI00301E1535